MTKSGRHSKNHGSLAGGISRGFAARDGSAVKSHSTILQRLRRQISLDYYTIPPATQAKVYSEINCWFARYVMAAVVVKNKKNSLLWGLKSVFM